MSKSKAEKYAQKYQAYNKLIQEHKPQSIECWIGQGKGVRCVAEVTTNGDLVMRVAELSLGKVPELIKWLIDTYGMPDR